MDSPNFVWIAIAIVSTLVSVFISIAFILHRKALFKKKDALKRVIERNYLDLFGASLRAAEKEKERIARNLHDEINPMLTLLKQNLQRHTYNMRKNRFELSDFENDYTLIDKIADGLRSSSYELAPAYLLRHGLIDSLHDHVNNLNKAGMLKTSFKKSIETRTKLTFGAADQLNIYRICLEIIHNLIKHSACSVLNFSLNITNTNFLVEMSHNGKGVDNKEISGFMQNGNGIGLKSLHSRALLLNATITYTKDKKTPSVQLLIPFKV